MLSSWFPDAVARALWNSRFSFRFSSLFSSCSASASCRSTMDLRVSTSASERRMAARRADGTSRYLAHGGQFLQADPPQLNQLADRLRECPGRGPLVDGLHEAPAAGSGDLADQALGLKGTQAFPDRVAADAEQPRQFRLGLKPVPARQFARQDRCPDLFLDLDPWLDHALGVERLACVLIHDQPRTLGSKSFPDDYGSVVRFSRRVRLTRQRSFTAARASTALAGRESSSHRC